MFTEKLLEVLKHELVKINGFIRSERFSSLVNERKILNLSV
ncbi:hypothetical protein [Clostridium botulinum]|nr:hypothetical protein [Clostridium botulinum]